MPCIKIFTKCHSECLYQHKELSFNFQFNLVFRCCNRKMTDALMDGQADRYSWTRLSFWPVAMLYNVKIVSKHCYALSTSVTGLKIAMICKVLHKNDQVTQCHRVLYAAPVFTLTRSNNCLWYERDTTDTTKKTNFLFK